MLIAQRKYKDLRDASRASQSAGANANVAEANTVVLDAATEYKHDESVSDEPEQAPASRKRKRPSATSAAKTVKPKRNL